ncbi:MAG: hypothetical protein JST85_30190 [Acidobacteria bacterium]|nr:hypothetical protein [Acidobacteriota bacterium]
MKVHSSVSTLSAAFLVAFAFQVAGAQITFVETPVRQRQGQQGQPGQSGLSPEKKRSLSKYGPEDAFPGAREQENSGKRTTRAATRNGAANVRPSPTITPAAKPSGTPSTIAAVTPTPASQFPLPSATAAALASSSGNSLQLNKTQPEKTGVSYLVPATLSLATLLVFGALIYVVGILRKKLKSES